MGSKERFLGLGRRRAAGACASAVLLLAGCTQVVTAHAKPDPVAMNSYMSSSSSSSLASVSSSRAEAAKQVICPKLVVGFVMVTLAWNDFVTALNGGDTVAQKETKALVDELENTSSQMKAAGADPGSDIGDAAKSYIDALDGLASILKRDSATSSEMNTAKDKITTAEQKLVGLCPN